MNKIVNKIKEKLKKVSHTTKQVASKAKDKVSHTTKEKLTDAKYTTSESLSSPLLPQSSTLTSTVIKEREQEQEQELSIVPSKKDLKNLRISDLVIMAYMSYDFDKRFKYFFERDAFTLPDPFKDPENYIYYLFVEKNNHSHIISMVIIRKDASIEKNTWYKIMSEDMEMLDLSNEQANEIKEELMPKETNNFYSFRKNEKIVGCIMFAYQICDLKKELEAIKT
jgi:hypothetical protein